METFLATKGSLIVKDFYDLEQKRGQEGCLVDFKALVIYEPGKESNRIRGLRITVMTVSGRFSVSSDTSFLDLEEIESLSKALNYMITLSSKWKDTNREYTEVIFSTKGDFRIGFVQEGVEMTSFASSGTIGKTCSFLALQDLESVKAAVDRGLALLKDK